MSKIRDMAQNTLYVSSPDNKHTPVFVDIVTSFYDFPNILRMAYNDILQKYRRSVLGPLWITASTIAFIVGFSLLGSIIFGKQRLIYISYLSAGIVFWQFIVTLLSESVAGFTNSSALIMSERTSFSSIILRIYLRNVISLMHNIPILLVIVLYFGSIASSIIYIIPAFILLSILLISWCFILAMLGNRFRDVIPGISMFLQFMFYFTPIFWPDDTVTEYPQRLMIDLNPFYHIISLLRAPFIGGVPTLNNWLIVSGLTVISLLVLLVIFSKYRSRLVYWL